MKVKQLIKELEKFNQEIEVEVYGMGLTDDGYWTSYPIVSVEYNEGPKYSSVLLQLEE